MTWRLLFCFLFILSSAALADTRPSEDSLRELLELTEAKKLLEGMTAQLDQMMEQSEREALKGVKIGAREKQVMKKMRERMAAVMKEQLSWESLEPFYLRVYQDYFTQAEVDGMLAFYRSDVGKAVIRKMPSVMQASMAEMQKRLPEMATRMKEITDEAMAELGRTKSH